MNEPQKFALIKLDKVRGWLYNKKNCETLGIALKESTYTRKQMDDCHRLRVAQSNEYEYYYQCSLQSLNLTSPMKSLHQIEVKLYLIFSLVQVTQEW